MVDPLLADPAEPQPLALRPRDAAKALGVCERTLATWEKAGIVPSVRIGTRKKQTVLYPVDALRAWLAERASAAQSVKSN